MKVSVKTETLEDYPKLIDDNFLEANNWKKSENFSMKKIEEKEEREKKEKKDEKEKKEEKEDKIKEKQKNYGENIEIINISKKSPKGTK